MGKTWGYVGKVVSLCGDRLGRVTVPVKIENLATGALKIAILRPI
jgi:hypothetical protein